MGSKLGLPEIILIVGIALLLFGPSKFASLGKGLGEGLRNFKSAMKEGEEARRKTTKKRSPDHSFNRNLKSLATDTRALPANPPHYCNHLQCGESIATPCLGSHTLPPCPSALPSQRTEEFPD